MSEYAIALKIHRRKLAALEAKPDPNREDRGSIEYHRDCIRMLQRLESREEQASKNDA